MRGGFTFLNVCRACGGSGQTNPNPCSSCGGSGAVKSTAEIQVDIPAGMLCGHVCSSLGVTEETVLNVPGGGHRYNGDVGDVLLQFQVMPYYCLLLDRQA